MSTATGCPFPTPAGVVLGRPRLHLRATGSTNDRARELAIAGAPHGTLVTAAEQTAGRGRQGRAWVAPSGGSLVMSLVLRDPPALLSLIAGVAVCDAVAVRGEAAIKWPNDVVAPDTLAKLGGILVEGRPQEGWAVVGIGLNVAVDVADLPVDVRTRAASLGLGPQSVEPLLGVLLQALSVRLREPAEQLLDAWRGRDALRGREVSWTGGSGLAAGVDEEGRLLVRGPDGALRALNAGEIHLTSVS